MQAKVLGVLGFRGSGQGFGFWCRGLGFFDLYVWSGCGGRGGKRPGAVRSDEGAFCRVCGLSFLDFLSLNP